MDVVRCFAVWVLILIAQTDISLQYFVQYKRNVHFDGKMCKESDVVFQGTPMPIVYCAGRCKLVDGCSGVMYNPNSDACVGCRGQYTNQTTLGTAVDTQYFDEVSEDWINFEGSLYKLSNSTWTFTDAMNYCQSDGGFVARIDSVEKTQFLIDTFGTTGDVDFWIGLTDIGHIGTWTWVNDDIETNYTNWNVGESQPDGTGNCVRAGSYVKYQWGDRYCGYEERVLCEIQV